MAIVSGSNTETVLTGGPALHSPGHSQLLRIDDGGTAERQDSLRRFTPTPHTTDLQLMRRTVRLETNNPAVLALAHQFFERHQHGRVGKPQFLWRIVCESDPQVQSTALRFSAFSDSGVRYVNIGQRGFLAVDLESREAMAFLPDRFVEGETRFTHPSLLDVLFCMTAANLGLVTLSGGLVGVEDRGVLIFGPPNSGKTTACYLATKQGMEFHADHAVFLDMRHKTLRAWGDLLPAVFRPETMQFLPELRQRARRSTYGDLSFYYSDKSPLQARRARPTTPVCSVFLDRGTTRQMALTRMTPEEAVSRLRECTLFNEEARFDTQITTALDALAEAPFYRLQYGPDPKIAATVIEELLR